MARANDAGRRLDARGRDGRRTSTPRSNLIGRLPGAAGARTLVLGSHLDTVRDAGAFDGPLGVLVAIAASASSGPRRTLPFAVEVVGFSDEEGVRFGTRVPRQPRARGHVRRRGCWTLRDADGVTRGRGAAGVRRRSRRLGVRGAGETLLGYCEVHIEQGPVLEQPRRAARRRHRDRRRRRAPRLTFTRRARATPGRCRWPPRRDALRRCGRVVARRRGARRAVARAWSPPSGGSAVEPGARNVIPGEAWPSLDVRHAERRRARARPSPRPARGGRGDRRRPRGRRCGWDDRGSRPRRSPTRPAADRAPRRRGRGRGPASRCAAQRRRPRRGGAGGRSRRGDAVRALRAAASATTPPSRSTGRRRGGARRARALRPRTWRVIERGPRPRG